MLDDAQQNQLNELVRQVQQVDDLSHVILKGHLVLEQTLVRIIGKFVHHSHHVSDRIQFAQRVGLARSMSLDEADHSMWTLVLALNTLRNKLAHSIDSSERMKAYDRLKQAYINEAGADARGCDNEPHLLAVFALAHCLGFLGSFESEVDRFKKWMGTMDHVVNPHRHGKDGGAC